MTTRKTYSSLNKIRSRGAAPHNLLNVPVHRIAIPTIDTVNVGKQLVVKPLNMNDPERSTEAKNCFYMNVNLEDCGLTLDPVISFDVMSVDYNGTSIDSQENGSLRLLVLARKDYIFIRRGRCFVDKMIIPCHAMKSAYFDVNANAFLLVLRKDFGYWNVKFSENHTKLYSFLQDRRENWISGHLKLVNSDEIARMHNKEQQRRENSFRDPVAITHCDAPANSDSATVARSPDDILRNGLPSELLPLKDNTTLLTKNNISNTDIYAQRRTRSQNTGSVPSGLPDVTVDINSSDTPCDQDLEESTELHETPAPFDPPLRYSVGKTEKFVITANDFKTLYNASWVNDTLIDFFIAYEIERAITELHTIKRSEVYAFNSFFHAKLFSSVGDEVPQYYENIRKWLDKLDLMSYQYLVIPIMENAHWFCIVIKGLPNLLSLAKEEARTGHEIVQAEDNMTSTNRGKTKAPAAAISEIYMLDSLRLPHPNLLEPIKMVLNEHCKEKHRLSIKTSLMKLRASRVPRQRNTSDCGIHVIYNLKKWLSEPSICELMWRKRTTSNRFYFNGQERKVMRKWCIDVLLELHSQQPTQSELKDGVLDDDIHSDDDIQEISFVHAISAEPISKQIVEQDLEKAPTKSSAPNSPIDKCEQDTSAEVLSPSASLVKQLSSVLDDESQLTQMEQGQDSDFSKLILSQFFEKTEAEQDWKSDSEFVSASPLSSPSPPDTKDEEDFAEVAKQNYYVKTLDPRVSETGGPLLIGTVPTPEQGFEFVQIQHPQLRKVCGKLNLSKGTKKFINSVFNDPEIFYDEDFESVITLIKNYEHFSQRGDTNSLNLIEEELRALLWKSRAPIGDLPESEVSQDMIEGDDSRELNRSVGDLRITSEYGSSCDGKSSPSFILESSESIQMLKILRVPTGSVIEVPLEVDTIEGGSLHSSECKVTKSDLRQIANGSNHAIKDVESVPDQDDDRTFSVPLRGPFNICSSPKRRRLDGA